jgi:hypothetical protein
VVLLHHTVAAEPNCGGGAASVGPWPQSGLSGGTAASVTSFARLLVSQSDVAALGSGHSIAVSVLELFYAIPP